MFLKTGSTHALRIAFQGGIFHAHSLRSRGVARNESAAINSSSRL